jgi:uncharacterized SAM-binding protein YcdF (DUF218 family)
MSFSQKFKTNKRTRGFTIFLIVIAALLLTAFFCFRGLGRWLVRQDSLAPADAIVVLSGSMPYRAEEAGKIFQTGYSHEVWISQPESPRSELKTMGILYAGEENYNREVLVHEGVPEGAIHIFPDAIENTEQEIEEVTREMQQQNKLSVIIVTSPQHTRRVRALWQKLADNKMKLFVRAAPEDPFDADHWWRNTRDALSVMREMLGLANAWAGLPVRPHLQNEY